MESKTPNHNIPYSDYYYFLYKKHYLAKIENPLDMFNGRWCAALDKSFIYLNPWTDLLFAL